MSKRTPLVSILIPVYNRAALVRRAIESALAQSHGNIEVIVCDNCSTDGTFAVVQEYAHRDSRVACYQNSSNLGPVKNWIRCVELSRGEYVRILFSDDWMDPACVERMLEPMLDHPDVGFCYSAVEVHEGDRHYSSYELNPEGRMDSVKFLHLLFSGSTRAPVTPGCGMFRREDALEFIPEHLPLYKGFDVNRRGIGNDVMLYLRACARYPYCFHLATPLTHCLAHEGSFSVEVVTGTPFLLDWCYIQAFAYFLKRAELPLAAKLRLSWDLRYYMFRLRVLEMLAPLARRMPRVLRTKWKRSQ